MRKTKNDLSEAVRTQSVGLLQARLADAIDLARQAKQAHWNVRGPQFFSLHPLFDKVYEEVTDHADTLAERLVALGGVADGTVQTVSRSSTLQPYLLGLHSGPEHVEALSGALSAFGKASRAAIDQAAEFKDADTADLFTGISRGIDQLLWMVEIHAA